MVVPLSPLPGSLADEGLLSDLPIEALLQGLPIVGEKGSMAKLVWAHLKGLDLLLSRISSHHLLQKTLRPDEQDKPMADIADAFLRYPQLPRLWQYGLL